MSSKVMAFHLIGSASSNSNMTSHPLDPHDLGRCIRLLDAVPDLRQNLASMTEVSPYWAALITNWDELEKAYRSTEEKVERSLSDGQNARVALYRRMKEIIRLAEEEDFRKKDAPHRAIIAKHSP